jgi:nitroimidazol reductase NimA-like FMN-containing flavoprotein (pyridoxamine 5'-phosphate oxidase superfamily)
MSEFETKKINKVKRHPERGVYDKDTIYGIVDETLFCHVSFIQEDRPFIIPVLHARQGHHILLHGATSSRLMRHIETGHEVTMAMTILDGLVLARSVFSHSANYRSAVLFGKGTLIDSDEEKLDALQCFTERLLPGRWQDARRPSKKELKATSIVSIPIDLGSAKIRQGAPVDEDADLQLPVWAGVIPIKQQMGAPIPDPELMDGIQTPDYVLDYVRSQHELAPTKEQ